MTVAERNLEPLDDIDRLNALVAKKVEKVVKAADTSGEKITPEVAAVLDGAQVYHRRYRWIVYFAWAFSIYGVCQAPSLPALLGATVFMYFYMDLFGGLLHVSLDNPNFIKLPGIDASCLEFQFHHLIPTDISSKAYVEVLGDLNASVMFTLVFVFGICKGLLGWPFDLNVGLMFAALKLLFAFAGQYSHRMAHTPDVQRPAIVKLLQHWCIMLPPHIHKQHHSSYTDAFPILNGHTTALLSFLLRTVPSEFGWLFIFTLALAFDIPLFATAYGVLFV